MNKFRVGNGFDIHRLEENNTLILGGVSIPFSKDLTIVLEAPKLKNYLPEMKSQISKCINLQVSNINIKATTSEKLGFIGRGEGVSCYASTLIKY